MIACEEVVADVAGSLGIDMLRVDRHQTVGVPKIGLFTRGTAIDGDNSINENTRCLLGSLPNCLPPPIRLRLIGLQRGSSCRIKRSNGSDRRMSSV